MLLRVRVGAFYDPRQDPMASEKDLREFAKKDPAAIVKHPNCPVGLWKELAAQLPFDAMKSPSFALFQLEDPEIWLNIEREYAYTWLMKTTSAAMEQDFVLDCLQYVVDSMGLDLSQFIPELMTARRAYMNRDIDGNEWTRVINKGDRAIAVLQSIIGPFAPKEAIEKLLNSIGRGLSYQQRQQVLETSSVWMWRRFLDYLYDRA